MHRSLLMLFAFVVGCGSAGNSGVSATDAGADAPASDDVGSDVAPAPDRLSISGHSILAPDGSEIVLRGWNWGEWGSEQPQDATDNVAQGANVVRLPLRWWGDYPDGMDARMDGAPGHIEPGHLTQLDGWIADATSKGLWVVLFVDSNCGQGSVTHDTVAACGTGSDGAPANFLNDADARTKVGELWSFLADHYARTPHIAMYELLSEPNFGCGAAGGCADWSVFPAFYAQLIPLVRAKDPRTPVLVGPGIGYDVRKMETAFMSGVDGVVYTGDLLAHAASDPASITALTSFRDAHDVPVFVQQVGIPKSDSGASDVVSTVLPALNGAKIGWTWWTYRETHNPLGKGFAPYYEGPGTDWMEDANWLAAITKYFSP